MKSFDVDWCTLQFAAHPSCQKKLTSLWYGDGDFDKLLRRRSKLVQTFVVAGIVLLYPVLSLIYIIAPNSLVLALEYSQKQIQENNRQQGAR